MLRYRRRRAAPEKPPKNPKNREPSRPRAFLSAVWRRVGAESWQTMLFTVLAAMAFARLASVAFANPAPVAVPGDIVAIGGPAAWPEVLGDMPARVLPSPWAASGAACELDIAYMAGHGGVLTVMAVRPDGVMMSWAGGSTAPGADACHAGKGGVLISDAEYRTLRMRLVARH